MTHEIEQVPAADAGPVQRPVRPAAWIRYCGDGTYEGPLADCDRRMEGARRTSGAWSPLYDQATLDAAVAAERERWTLLLTKKWHSGDGPGQTLAQFMEMEEAEYAAWVSVPNARVQTGTKAQPE